MRQVHDTISIATAGPQLVDVTSRLTNLVRASGIREGLATILVLHTSASLVIQENADPSVRRDLEAVMSRLVPHGAEYEHDAEGADDMPSHARSALTSTSLSIPIHEGRLRLGTWQAVYLWEHRDRGHHREIAVHLMGE